MAGKVHRETDPLTRYCVDHSVRLHPVQQQLIEVTKKHEHGRMLGSADELQLLANLCKYMGAKKTLDIGVFTGYSALSVALVLPQDGRVVACDVSTEYTDIGKEYWKAAGVDQKIDLRIAPAVETLESLLTNGEAGTYDFAFIDADKPNYDNYYELCLKLLRPGGLIAIDNVLWGGSVINPENQEPGTVAIRALNDKIAKDTRVDVSMLKMADGVNLAFKKF